MGNCSPKGISVAKGPISIRIMTDAGNIVEYECPKLAREVLRDFPGYGIFGQGRVSSPLLDHEELHGGRFYYLLPLEEATPAQQTEKARSPDKEPHEQAPNIKTEPERMSTSAAAKIVNGLKSGSGVEVLLPPQKGVWRVKLVIDTKQLEEILSGQANTEALIEQMRLVASSASVTPRRTRISWGQWGVNWKPVLPSMFKGQIDHRNGLLESGTGSPRREKAAGELNLAK
ncbi:hypothetical protein NMG60_11026928 [Bertholletia excelsa]